MKTLFLSLMLLISVESIATDKKQCKGITAKGANCSRKVDKDYCYQHERSHNNTVKAIASNKAQCNGVTKTNKQCSRNASSNTKFCFQHS